MRFPWNLIDRFVCLHCWAFGRFGTPKDSLRENFRIARSCVANRKARP